MVPEKKPQLQVMIRVDGSRRVTLRNRRFVKKLNPEFRRMPIPAPVQPKPTKKSPVKKKIPESFSTFLEVHQVHPIPKVPRGPLIVADDQEHREEVREVVDEQVDQAGLVEDAHVDVDVPAEQPLPAQTETELPGPVIDQPRTRKNAKAHPKYSPEVNDLSYVGTKSRVGGVLERQEGNEQVPDLLGERGPS